jgi:type II secretory pathway component PulC
MTHLATLNWESLIPLQLQLKSFVHSFHEMTKLKESVDCAWALYVENLQERVEPSTKIWLLRFSSQ